jgi:hypothetical protein
MTLPRLFFRGATVPFSVILASGGPSRQPASAAVAIVYTAANGNPAQATIALAASKTSPVTWTGTWDSTPAAPGIVSWSIRTGANRATDSGQFQVVDMVP